MIGRQARRRGRRANRTSLAFTVMAGVVILGLVAGTLVALLADRESNGPEPIDDGPQVLVTPGAEIARLETRVAENPDDVDAIVVLAEVQANSGRTQESIRWFELAVQKRPDDPRLRIAFARSLVRMGSDFDAELQLQRAVELDPTNAEAPFYLGELYETMSPPRLSDAIAWYERVIELEPDSIVAEQARSRIAELTPSASPTASE